MRVTDLTRERLRCRRTRRKLLSDGYEEIGEGGGNLWELYRGYRRNHIITAAVIAPEGKSIFIKTQSR